MMTYNTVLIKSDRYIEYINKHKHAFDIYEDLYPLKLFEDFVQVQSRRGDWLYCCSNIDKDKFYPARFTFGFPTQKEAKLLHNPQSQLQAAFDFFRKVESRADVKLNYRLIQQFFSIHPDFRGITWIVVGVDAHPVITDSRLKLFMYVINAPEKVETLIALCGDSPTLRSFLVNDILFVGFDLFFDGRSEIELYPTITNNELQRIDIRSRIVPLLPARAIPLLDRCHAFQVGISRANESNILYFDNVFDPNSFIDNLGNEMAKKVHAYYRHQPFNNLLVGIPESNFYARSIEQVKMYYEMSNTNHFIKET